MSIMTQLSLVAVHFVVSGACKATLGLSEDAAERAIGVLIDERHTLAGCS